MHDDDHHYSPTQALLHPTDLGEDVETIGAAYFHSYHEMEAKIEMDSHRRHSSSISSLNLENSAALTTFLLLNAMIGSGILNQPYVFRQSGILGGLLGFLVAATATWTGLLCLTAAGIKEEVYEYSGLARRAFDKMGERLVDMAIIVLTFGSQLGYILVVGTTSADLLRSWGCESEVCGDYFTTIISVVVFVTPVCMFRHFGHLAFLSLFSIAAIVAVLLLVIIAGPAKHRLDHISSDYKAFSFSGMLQSTGSIIFSLACTSGNFQAFVSTEKSAQNMSSWAKITGRAVACGAMMCMTMGVAGYLSFADDTEGEILDNFKQHGYDFFKAMVVVHLILYIPVNFVIMRYSIVKMATGLRSELLGFWTHSILTIVLMAGVTSMVILLLSLGLASGEAFSLILNITGGIGGSLATLILPAAIYLKVMPTDSGMYWHARVLLAMGIFVMIAVLTVTFMQFAK